MGCLHQDMFTRKVTDIAFTSDVCNNYSHPASPASLFLTSPRPTRPLVPYLMCSSPSSRVPKSKVPSPHTRVPMSPSPCPRSTFIHSLQILTFPHNITPISQGYSSRSPSLVFHVCGTAHISGILLINMQLRRLDVSSKNNFLFVLF